MTGTKAKAIGVVVLVFILGGVAGASVAYAFGQRRIAELVADDRDELHERRRMRALRRALDLTDDQAARIQEALEKRHAAHREAMDQMFETCGGPIEELRKQLDADILSILTPEQQERFKAFAEKHRGHLPFGRRGHRRPPGAHRPPPDHGPEHP